MTQPKGEAPLLRIGLAGEYRVMSELLIRGFYPAKTILDEGIDLILLNGKTIQVKTARRVSDGGRGYKFTLYSRFKHPLIADYYIFWLVNDDKFLIVPKEQLGEQQDIRIITSFKGGYSYSRSKLTKFIDAWHLIN